jgi:hypothetical protein
MDAVMSQEIRSVTRRRTTGATETTGTAVTDMIAATKSLPMKRGATTGVTEMTDAVMGTVRSATRAVATAIATSGTTIIGRDARATEGTMMNTTAGTTETVGTTEVADTETNPTLSDLEDPEDIIRNE